MSVPRLAPKGSRSSAPRRSAPKAQSLVAASLVASMVSFVPGTRVEVVVVVRPMSQIAVAASGEVAMMLSTCSAPVARAMPLMPGLATLDPIARPVQRVGEDGVAVERCHERQNVEMAVDPLTSMAIAGFCVGGEE